MRHPVIWAAIIIVAGLLAAQAIGPRYQIVEIPVAGVVLGLNTRTGEIVTCRAILEPEGWQTPAAATWACKW